MSDSGKNKAAIGAFVVGAVALAVVGVIVFGGGKMFEKKTYFVMYFDGSVKGLNIGAPVSFRGVKIGSVTDVTVHANTETLEFRIPVVVEIIPDKIEKTAAWSQTGEQRIKTLVAAGLRAQLDVQSMVTGQLIINLRFLPDEPVVLSGVKNKYPEIPTIPSSFQRIFKSIESLPIHEVLEKASKVLTTIEAFLENPALKESVDHINQAAANAEQFTATIDQKISPLLDSFHRMADHADQLVLNVNGQVQPVAKDARHTLKSVDTAAGKISHAADAFADLSTGAQPMVTNVTDMTSPNSTERRELNSMLKELSEAAKSIRVLSSYLERHPEALITGKGGSQRR